MTCRICNRPSKREGTCVICELKVKGALIELPQLQFEAGFYLEPSRTGSGFVSSERSIGINVSALDFSLATDLLAILHGWEQIVRKDRNLTPPAYVPKAENTEIEVQATCDFHLVHLSWSLSQDWAVEFSSEVLSLHAKGRAATKKFREQARRIPCPTDDCKKFIVIDVEQLQNDVSCFNSSSPEDSSDREDLRNVGTNLLCFSHQRLPSLDSDGSKPMALNISIGIGEIETELATDSDLSFDAIESLLNRAVVSVLQLYMALPEKDRMSVVGLEMEDDEDEDVE
jgi:hypothetical protein